MEDGPGKKKFGDGMGQKKLWDIRIWNKAYKELEEI